MKKKVYIVVPFLIFGIGLFLGLIIGLFFEWNKNEFYDTERLWPMLNAEDKNRGTILEVSHTY